MMAGAPLCPQAWQLGDVGAPPCWRPSAAQRHRMRMKSRLLRVSFRFFAVSAPPGLRQVQANDVLDYEGEIQHEHEATHETTGPVPTGDAEVCSLVPTGKAEVPKYGPGHKETGLMPTGDAEVCSLVPTGDAEVPKYAEVCSMMPTGKVEKPKDDAIHETTGPAPTGDAEVCSLVPTGEAEVPEYGIACVCTDLEEDIQRLLATPPDRQRKTKRYQFRRNLWGIWNNIVHDVVLNRQSMAAEWVSVADVLKDCDVHDIEPEQVVQILDVWVFELNIMQYEEQPCEHGARFDGESGAVMLFVKIRDDLFQALHSHPA